MEHAFEIYTQDGVMVERHPYRDSKQGLLADIVARLDGEPWYRVSYHVCLNTTNRPCNPWQTVSEHGDVPDEE